MESIRHQDIQISGHKITKQMIRETFALYSPEYEAFVIELPNKQFHGVLRRYPRLYLPAMRRKSNIAWEWVKYERCRIIRGLDIPPVDIVRANGVKNKETGEVTFKITRIDLTPRELYAVQYGDTFGIYAASAHAKGCDIRYAISRKGRSYSLVNEAFPTSYHVNTYSFFDNDDDYVLAKLMLAGKHIIRDYGAISCLVDLAALSECRVEEPVDKFEAEQVPECIPEALDDLHENAE